MRATLSNCGDVLEIRSYRSRAERAVRTGPLGAGDGNNAGDRDDPQPSPTGGTPTDAVHRLDVSGLPELKL